MPGVNVAMLDGALAWRQHDGGHTDGPNVEHFIRWAKISGERTRIRMFHSPQPDRRSLKEAVGDRFKIGVGVGHDVLQNPEDAALIQQHFEILTPENCMKPQGIHPAEDEWNFEATDRFADFARANELEIVGHCLVWAKDDRTDPWMMQEDGKPVSRETLLRRIETHVKTVVERYADVVTMWDVVNEAIGDGERGLLRDSVYSRTTGMDFIVTAFKAARAKDPDALLIYNDYNCHKPGKREKLIELLTQLKRRELPSTPTACRAILSLATIRFRSFAKLSTNFESSDIKVVVSELDIDVVTRGRWWAEAASTATNWPRTTRTKTASRKRFSSSRPSSTWSSSSCLTSTATSSSESPSGTCTTAKAGSIDFPWQRVNYPLLFDRDRKPKPVFDAVFESLQAPGQPMPLIERRRSEFPDCS